MKTSQLLAKCALRGCLCQQSGVIRCSPDGVNAICAAVAGQAEAERCDGADNDCDGVVDEAS